MVIGHSACPAFMGRFIYSFHMPLFFIASGYFFSTKYTDDKFLFIKKRFKGLYLPFVKWSLIFLFLHNQFFKANILNARFGRSELFSFEDIIKKAFNIITCMKKLLLTVMLTVTTALFAQKPIELPLWPNGAPNSNELKGTEQENEKNRISNVVSPTITIYKAKDGNGKAIIMCPGGGYARLAMDHEGHAINY